MLPEILIFESVKGSFTVLMSLNIFSRQEYWRGLPFPSPGDLLDPGIEPVSLMSPALAGGFFISSATWKVENMKQIRRKLSLLSSAYS